MKRTRSKRFQEWLAKQRADSKVPPLIVDERALADGAEILRGSR